MPEFLEIECPHCGRRFRKRHDELTPAPHSAVLVARLMSSIAVCSRPPEGEPEPVKEASPALAKRTLPA
jgi:hypothetical protein